ncbi:MAG: pyoverdine-tailoring dipeptidase-like protein PvdM [Sphingomonadales bacterium]
MRALLIATLLLAASGPAQADEDKARKLHDRTLTVDSHIDLPRDWATSSLDVGALSAHQADLVKMAAGGLKAAFFIAYTGQKADTPQGLDEARRESFGKLLAIHRMAHQHPDKVALAWRAEDAARITDQGRIAAFIGMENGFPIGQDLDWLRLAYEGGVRYVTLTHNGHNQLGDSAQPKEDLGDAEKRHGGLSAFGRAAVAEMNRLGILIDISHTAHKTTMEAVRLSKAPVIASHSSAKALADVPRNLSDKAIKAIAKRGGVIHIVAFPSYLIKSSPAEEAERDALYQRYQADELDRPTYEALRDAVEQKYGPADIEDLIDHIDHVVKLVGVDHVGISSDFGGGGGIVGWRDARDTPNVTAALLARGYSPKQIGKIWGGNLLRALADAERVAARLQAEAKP